VGRYRDTVTRTYAGTRRSNGTTSVSVDGQPLGTRTEMRSASAAAFDWGYEGRGAPAQLALAILADHFGDDDGARRHYEQFLRRVVRGLPSQQWVLTAADIDGVLPESRR
jgi:Family of unknown function (DUF6166)